MYSDWLVCPLHLMLPCCSQGNHTGWAEKCGKLTWPGSGDINSDVSILPLVEERIEEGEEKQRQLREKSQPVAETEVITAVGHRYMTRDGRVPTLLLGGAVPQNEPRLEILVSGVKFLLNFRGREGECSQTCPELPKNFAHAQRHTLHPWNTAHSRTETGMPGLNSRIKLNPNLIPSL